MASPTSCLPPGPREPDFVGLPNSNHGGFPSINPFFRNRSMSDSNWDVRAPLSQSRPYVSPDPSPLEDRFDQQQQQNRDQIQSQSQTSISPISPNGPETMPLPMTIPLPREGPYHLPILQGRPPSGTMLQPRYFMNTPQAPPAPAPARPMPFWQQEQGNDPWFNPIMLPQTNKSRSSKKEKKIEGKQPTFLTRLFGILEQEEYQHIIRWDETGEAIIIENPEELAEKILPVIYRQSRFASFSRQLNIYGFNRKLSLRHVERGICDPDASTWSHPFLNKYSSKAEILGFKRRVPPRPTQAQKRRMSLQDEGRSPTSSEQSLDFHSPPDAYHHHLLPDVDEESQSHFTHPRGPFQSHEFHSTTFQAPRPEYFAYQSHSPPAHEFDYSSPSGHLERSSMARQTSFNAHDRGLFRIEPPSMFADRGQSFGGPQSAPPVSQSFPVPIKVTQQHVRTRSVQGEPPSAMLYSPLSPYNTASWLSGEVPEPQMKKEESISPTSLPPRELHSLGSSQSIFGHEDHPKSGHLDFFSSNMNSRGFDSSPQSVPNDFGSSDSLHLPQIQGQSADQNPPLLGWRNNSSDVNNMHTQSFSALSPQSPSTISPGVSQGYTFPIKSEFSQAQPQSRSQYTPPVVSKPLAFTPTKPERRMTMPFTPYSPRNKPAILNGSSLRTISSRRGSPALIQGLGLRFNDDDDKERDEDHEALPSASINFEEKHPFEGILGGEEIGS
ncbi:uncharacterized protein I303_103391 [Kwoniella dejecticola CBS 10117]|uniref:HSF-type DNA-binding domain-containing protein n=1 Tax=Kwoniella dejecticola CBS 10117 TaxID=1296121 RepID=A0A1A6A6M3_9TREE|nr:uncharacterized protein I303_03414 [Kwoniella dejecticola CBS 10117]OBR85703.1 hypothetical protein I303_03414 [Kwoniella dejecticola CBS 10117]